MDALLDPTKITEAVKQNILPSTGNQYIDGLIVTTIAPMLIAYLMSIFSFFKSALYSFWDILQNYVKTFLQIKLTGKILAEIDIVSSNIFFEIIKKKIFANDVKSDVEESMFKKLYNFSKFENKPNEVDIKKLKINLNYDDKKLFSIDNDSIYTTIENKVFKYKNFYIRISKQGSINGTEKVSKITIELLTFSSAKFAEDECCNIIKQFLCDRFDITENIYFTYRLQCKDNDMFYIMHDYLNRFTLAQIAKNLSDDMKFLSSLIQPKSDINTKQRFNIVKKVKNLNKSTDKDDRFDLTQNYEESNDSTINIESYGHIFAQGKSAYIRYFCKNNTLVYINISMEGFIDFYITSFKKQLSQNDLQDIVNYIIDKKYEHDEILLKNKKPAAKPEKNTTYCYKYSSEPAMRGWIKYSLDRRSFDTVFMDNKILSQIKKEFESFFAIESLYKDCDIPYRKGILFYGPPGTGKTSLVKALSYEYQLPIYTININDSDINDDTIVDMLNAISGTGNKILLFEDIDSAFSEKEKIKHEQKDSIDSVSVSTNKKYLTYAGLLNALDGVLTSRHGVITIMTTNYVDKLGDALIRPGRIDHKYLLTSCNKDQIIQMTEFVLSKHIICQNRIKRQYNEDHVDVTIEEYNLAITNFAEKLVNKQDVSQINPCKLQQYILKYIENFNDIFNNYNELLL